MSIESKVSIRLGLEDFRLSKNYDVRLGVFDQPSSFAMTIGGGTPKELMDRYPPETPFQIAVEDREQFSGYTDGFDGSGNESSSDFSIKGRDTIKELFHSEIEREDSFTAPTHRGLIELAIADLEIRRPFTGELVKVLSSNAENRRAVSGQSSLNAQDDVSDAALATIAGASGDRFQVLRTKLGETYFSLLRRHLDAIGCFIWCAASGDLVVGQPNFQQPASATIARGPGKRSNVKSWRFFRDNTSRFSEVAIYGRTTGRKTARTTTKGAYTDDDLLDQGHRWVKVLRDAEVTSTAHAEHLAKKKLAEGRRAGFGLSYTLSGHTTKSLLTGMDVCWAPDTVVFVDDEYLGIRGNYWIEQVQHQRDARSGTRSTLKLLEPEALVFDESAVAAMAAIQTAGGTIPKKIRQPTLMIINGVRVPISISFDRKRPK